MNIAETFKHLKEYQYRDDKGEVISYDAHAYPAGEFGHAAVLEKIKSLHSGKGISIVFGGFFGADIIRVTGGKGLFCDINSNQKKCYDAVFSMSSLNPNLSDFLPKYVAWEKSDAIPIRVPVSHGQPRSYRAIKNWTNDQTAYADFSALVSAGNAASITLNIMDEERIRLVADLIKPFGGAGLVYVSNIPYYVFDSSRSKDFARGVKAENPTLVMARNLTALCNEDAIIVDATPSRSPERGPGETFKLDATHLQEYILDITKQRGMK